MTGNVIVTRWLLSGSSPTMSASRNRDSKPSIVCLLENCRMSSSNPVGSPAFETPISSVPPSPLRKAQIAFTHALVSSELRFCSFVSHCMVCLNSSPLFSPFDISESRSAVFSMLRSSSRTDCALDGRSSRSVDSIDKMSLSRLRGMSLRQLDGGGTCRGWPVRSGSLPVRSS